MPTRELVVFETVTGQIMEVLPTIALTWNTPIESGGKIEATVPVGTPDVRYLNLRALTTPWRYSLAVLQGNQVLCAGIINGPRDWSTDSPKEMKLTATELWCLLEFRPLLGDYTHTDPLTDVTFDSASLPGLAAAILDQAITKFPSGSLPIVLPDLEPGSNNTRTYTGTDLKDTKSALEDLSKVQNGPDIVFDAQLVNGGQQVQWVARVGRPMLTQTGEDLVIDYPGGQTQLEADEDPAGMASTMLLTAQQQQEQDETATAAATTADAGTTDADTEEKTLVARFDNLGLLNLGYPAMWLHNGDHTDVSEQATLDAYAKSYGQAAAHPVTEYPFTIPFDHQDYPLGTYRRGDTVQLVVGTHPWLPAGSYRVRITELACDNDKGEVSVTVAEQPGALSG